MKQLRSFFGSSDQSTRSTLTAPKLPEEPQTTRQEPENHAPSSRKPCGPDCWLKEFLAYPEPPDDIINPSPGCTPANDQERRDIAMRLYTTIHPYQTRIIKLLPGPFIDPVSCELLTADLIALPGLGLSSTGDMVLYDCLSYSWGYPVFSHRVHCNGLEVPVIASLYEALRHLRLGDKPRYLWIDAFCINQFDNVEKSAQVRNMLLVYQKCETVRAWLGMPQGQDRIVASYLRKIYWGGMPTGSDKGKFHDSACAQRYATVWSDMNGFFSAQWWSRTWIRQEFFASRVLTFHIGPDTYDWNYIFSTEYWEYVARSLQRERTLEIEHVRNLDCLEAMRMSRIPMKRWMRDGTLMDAPVRRLMDTGSWMEGLSAGIRFGASDMRDKVYGIVGMLEEQSKVLDREADITETVQRESFLTQVDYSKSVSTINRDIIKFLISRDRNLLPLCVFRDRVSVPDVGPAWALSLHQDIRSWFIASHVTGEISPDEVDTTDPLEAMIFYYITGHYGDCEVDTSVDGSLGCNGYRIGTIKIPHQGGRRPRLMPKDVSILRAISTSPPISTIPRGREVLPEGRLLRKTHTFVQSYDELEHEAKYRAADIDWIAGVDMIVASTKEDTNPHTSNLEDPVELVASDLTALVSQAAGDGDEVVLLQGSPLPMVIRREVRDGSSVYRFLGPACWMWSSSKESVNRMNSNAPGFTETARMYQYVQKHLEVEKFCLV